MSQAAIHNKKTDITHARMELCLSFCYVVYIRRMYACLLITKVINKADAKKKLLYIQSEKTRKVDIGRTIFYIFWEK